MEEIKNKILVNYSEKNLSTILYYYGNMDVDEVIYFWSCINLVLNKDNVLCIISFLMNYQDKPLIFPRYAQRALNYHIHQVNKKMAKLLSRKYSQYVKHLKLFRFTKEDSINEYKQKAFDPFDYLINSVYDMLVKTSSLEIVNSVENYFYAGFTKDLDLNLTPILLGSLRYTHKRDANLYIKCISTIIDTPRDILEYINNNKPYSDILIQSIYVYNYDLYAQILPLIYESWKYYRVELFEMLVEFDLTQCKFRDENLDVLKYVVANRPAYLKDAVEVLTSSMSRSAIISLLVEFYDSLKTFFNDLDMSFEEAIEVSAKNVNVLNIAYQKAKTPEDRDKFLIAFKNADESFILQFLKEYEDVNLVSFIVTHKQLKGELRDFIKRKYLHEGDLFYKLLIYCEKDELYPCIRDYLVDKKSMTSFLLVLKPTDILIFALSMEDLKAAMRIIDLSFEMSNFNENDFIYTLNTCEPTLPPLLMRVLILTFKKYPHLKSFVVSFLYKIISRDILGKDSYMVGFIKCLEMLDSASIDILASLPERSIIYILERSRVLCKLCRENLFRRDISKRDLERRNLEALRNIVRERF